MRNYAKRQQVQVNKTRGLAVKVIFLIIIFAFLLTNCLNSGDPDDGPDNMDDKKGLYIGNIEEQSGAADVSVPVTLNLTDEEQATGINVEVSFDPALLTFKSVTEGAAATAADKSVGFNSPSSGVIKFVVFGINQNVLTGGVIANLVFDISPDAVNQTIPLSFAAAGTVIADIKAEAVKADLKNGSIIVK